MSTPHKASAEQWASVRRRAEISGISDCCVIVELAARIEALEREAAMNELRAASAEARPSVKESLTVLPSPAGLLVEPEITQRELCRIWNDSPDPDEESGDAMARLYSAGFHAGMKWQAELLKQPVTEQVSAPAPASSLVERVVDAITDSAAAYGTADEPARAAIREVAAWLRDRGGYPWAWVAQLLEKEAGRG